jgi:putative dimethyl sulfoxide reductase chaperone
MREPPAAPRSRLYSLLSGSFAFPSDVFYDSARAGILAGQIAEAVADLPFELTVTTDVVRPECTRYEDFQSEYIGNFEVGTAGPPCPLYAGVYTGGRTQVWEELIRFYNLFGVHLSPENRDLPDHLSTELEFMHFLTWKELASEAPAAVASLRKAQRDFLERQVIPWTGLLAKRAEKSGAPAFYRGLLSLTNQFMSADLNYLKNNLAISGHSALVEVD